MLKQEIMKEWGMNYKNLATYLQNKYGLPQKSYFYKGMNTANRSITRTKDGLFIHHIAENMASNLSNPKQAKENPAEYQEPQMLLYCNILEHMILHIKILEETEGQFGIFGLGLFIIPTLNEYYTYGTSRLQFWEDMCYQVVKDNYSAYIFLLKEYIKVRNKIDNEMNLIEFCNELSWDREGKRINEIYVKLESELFYKLQDGTIYSKDRKTLIYWGNDDKEIRVPDGIINIYDTAFRFNRNLSRVVLPDSMKKIGKDLFRSCYNLIGVELPNGIKEISDSAFMWCRSLKEIQIPDSVEKIGDNAFCDCRNIVEIILPARLKEIGYNAFKGCQKLKSVIFKDASGWKFGRACSVVLTKDELSNSVIAAQYLTKTTKFCNRHWLKSY